MNPRRVGGQHQFARRVTGARAAARRVIAAQAGLDPEATERQYRRERAARREDRENQDR